MLVLCDILEMDGVQNLYYVIYLQLMVCNACTMWNTWQKWCAILVICDILETNGVQCLYYVIYLNWMGCKKWNVVLCEILERNGVQCLYYVIYLKQMVCSACTMWYTWDKWCAMLVLCDKLEMDDVQGDILEMDGVQHFYYVIYLKEMVCNSFTMWYTWNGWSVLSLEWFQWSNPGLRVDPSRPTFETPHLYHAMFLLAHHSPLSILHVDSWSPGAAGSTHRYTHVLGVMCNLIGFAILVLIKSIPSRALAVAFIERVLLQIGFWHSIHINANNKVKYVFKAMCKLLSIWFSTAAKWIHQSVSIEHFFKYTNKAVTMVTA